MESARSVHAPVFADSDPYEILEKLGEGGMGVVYKARDKRLDRVVALKLVSSDHSADPAARKRLLREARAAARLDHPNICTVFGVEEISGHTCIAMQLVEGKTLREIIISGGALSLPRFFELGQEIVVALEAAHRRGVTHRDLKPANIMVTSDGRVKVLDFGLAQLSGTQTDASTLTAAKSTAGTLGYIAPEQLWGEPADARSDVFSLGVVFFEMLTGKLPFARETTGATLHAILHDDPPDPRTLRSEIPENLTRLLEKALSKDRSRRHQNMAELLADLRTCAGVSDISEAPTRRLASVIRRREIPRSAIWIAGAAASVLVGVILWFILWKGGFDSSPRRPLESSPAAVLPPIHAPHIPPSQSEAPALPTHNLPSIAALPFSNLNRDPELAHLESGVADALTQAIVRSGRYRLVERAQLDQVLRELKLNQSDYVNPATAQKVGRLIGAQFLIIGSFQAWHGQMRLNARLLRVETGEIAGAWNRTGPLLEALSLPDELAKEIVAAMPGAARGRP